MGAIRLFQRNRHPTSRTRASQKQRQKLSGCKTLWREHIRSHTDSQLKPMLRSSFCMALYSYILRLCRRDVCTQENSRYDFFQEFDVPLCALMRKPKPQCATAIASIQEIIPQARCDVVCRVNGWIFEIFL